MPQAQTSTAATVTGTETTDEWRARERFLSVRHSAPKVDRKPEPFTLPDIPQLRHVARRIDDEDEGELRWFLRGPLVASIANSSGAFGNQLEQAESFGFGSLPCRRCNGRWRIRRRGGKEAVVGWRDGTGLAPKDRFGKRVTYAAALAEYRQRMQAEHKIVLMSKPVPKQGSGIDADAAWVSITEAFKAQGKTLMTDADFRDLWPNLPEALCQPCRVCGGIGIVPRRAAAHVEVTVFPTGSSKRIGGRENDDASALSKKLARGAIAISDGSARVHMAELERYLAVRAILDDVASLSMLARLALEEYYSGRSGRPSLVRETEAAEGNAAKSGQRAIEEMVETNWGLRGAARMRAASELRDFSCRCYQLAAYGGAT